MAGIEFLLILVLEPTQNSRKKIGNGFWKKFQVQEYKHRNRNSKWVLKKLIIITIIKIEKDPRLFLCIIIEKFMKI